MGEILMTKKIVWMVLVVILVLAGVYAFIANRQSESSEELVTDTPVVVPAVENSNLNLPPVPPQTPNVR
ncbi:hypothetical protein COT76_02325 [Candidatus Berkelbacteria bacterium CG10_big_fil_rev_8_21_14_0_10_33_10]|nr:MAG: hypothetical protein COT76_02325 [Candidatus Berkelbacteria bacterium CG10_big_fil_rev_8_21_14_0_10_33_10]